MTGFTKSAAPGSRIIGNQRERAIEWVGARWPEMGITSASKFTFLILENNLAISAVVGYNNWYPNNSIDLSVAALAGKRWLTRPFLSAAFRYPFVQLGVRRVGCDIASTNAHSLRFARHIGFVDEGIKRQAGQNGTDIISLGMLKSECRWLNGLPPHIWEIIPSEHQRSSAGP